MSFAKAAEDIVEKDLMISNKLFNPILSLRII